jgi:hypothetical protein
MPDKPIETCDEIKTAVQKDGTEHGYRREYVIRRAIELGCTENIPDDWEIEVSGNV